MTDAQTERTDTQPNLRWNFWWASTTGVLFQGGVAFLDTSTVIAAFVSQLTPSAVAVGAAELIARFGWLGPQIFAAHYARGRAYRKNIYLFGGWGRAAFIGLLGLLLVSLPGLSAAATLLLFFLLWTLYAFTSGLVGVPYNDIIGRTIPSERRSRMLAWRFLGGGVLAVGAGLAVEQILARPDLLPFPTGYGLIFVLAGLLLAVSTVAFSRMREPRAPVEEEQPGFSQFLSQGLTVLRQDQHFRLFLVSQWLASITQMVVPLYILQAQRSGLAGAVVGTLLTARMIGYVSLNPLWGWWGDRQGKLSLLSLLTLVSLTSPLLAIALAGQDSLLGYAAVFFFLGAVASGGTIADLGYLMEISPDSQRPQYTGYLNALAAPARTFPLFAAGLVEVVGFGPVFALAALGALARFGVLRRLAALGQVNEEQANES